MSRIRTLVDCPKLVAAAVLALAVCQRASLAQYGNNPPPRPPKEPAVAEPPAPPPAEAQPPAPPAPPAQTKPAATQPAKSGGQRVEVQPADVKWLDRVPKDDRTALDELLGWAPPRFTSEMEWIGEGGKPVTWDDMRGKVVVLQSFTTANVAGQRWPARVVEAMKDITPKDLRIIALHTPEGADKASSFLEKKPAPPSVTVVVDPKGAFCDALAIYKHPINFVIDRNGAVRYAALNVNGLEQAVKALVAEPFDQHLMVAQRESSEDAADVAGADFPPFTGVIEHANDIRGRRAPEFYVDEWLNGEAPDARGKVVLIDFWATNCGPCIASIPHMNAMAEEFRDDTVFVGISHEKMPEFEKGMQKLKEKNITIKSFEYPVALDPSRKMYNALNVTAIPHGIVMDSNWIVRWQGHPASLDKKILAQIIKADKAQAGDGKSGSAKPSPVKRKRWTSGE